jgi:hypothetical protein
MHHADVGVASIRREPVALSNIALRRLRNFENLRFVGAARNDAGECA